MHPLVLESIAEQRLEDLRKDRHPVTGGRPRRGPGRARTQFFARSPGPNRGQGRCMDGDRRVAPRP